MSITSHLVCTTCKEYIWIGQSDFIYIDEKETMIKLQEFLQKHRTINKENEHKLLFMSEPFNGVYEDEGWKDVDDETL